MNKIAVLSHQEAQKIAAGEVVERPANIVKELVENALDAGSTSIELHIKAAGKELIQVVDNGCGMNKADAELCFAPHATSKITGLNDLVALKTFGFRGEALASIAAVSKVTLKTALHVQVDQQAPKLGSTVVYEGSVLVSSQDEIHPHGSNFCIEDLFYNVPVRKKFLKQDETEWNQIIYLMQGFCLSNLLVHFKIYKDGRLFLNLPAVHTIQDRVAQLWDYSLAQSMVSIATQEQEKSLVGVNGVVSMSHVWRYGKQQIFIFVNNRLVKDSELIKAVLKGYLNVLPPGKYPAVVLFITVDSAQVDVNVHPKKEEVRFSRPGIVLQAIKDAVQKALALQAVQSVTLHKNSLINEELVIEKYEKKTDTRELVFNNKSPELLYENFLGDAVLKSMPFVQVVSPQNYSGVIKKEQVVELPQPVIQQTHIIKESTVSSGKFIAQIFNTYLLIEQDDACIMVDQHAAHERVLYEKMITRFEQAAGSYLMFPQIVQCDVIGMQLLEKNAELMQFHGITFDDFGDGKLALKTAPPGIIEADLTDFIYSCIAVMKEHEQLNQEEFRKSIHEHIHSHMACKAALKAGDSVTAQQAEQLFADLQKTEKPFICIHGRPTMWRLAKHEIEKQFRRK